MNIGIRAVTSYSPDKFIDNLTRSESLASSREFILNKIGMLKLPQMPIKEDASDMAKFAVDFLCTEHNLKLSNVDCLVVVTQNPDASGLPHTSAILHKKLNLDASCAVFDISLGCSGYVQGLSIIQSFMKSNGFSNGILVTSDPYSKIVNKNDRNTAMLFGDGASATWLSSDMSLWDIGSFDFGIDSSRNDALNIGKDGYLKMNGRVVFDFAATNVPASVKNVLIKEGLTIKDIDLVLLHQGSKYIVEVLAKRIGAEGRTPFGAENTGNTISSSIPMMLSCLSGDSAKTILLSGFGVGLSWATCLLQRRV
jgi:3-oxoacyl-[acyl-carrier-protein] synthase III